MPLIQHKKNPLTKWNTNSLVKGGIDSIKGDFTSKLVTSISAWADKIFPGLGSVLGGLLKLLDGCPDFNKEQVYNEEVSKARTYIAHFKRMLVNPKFGKTFSDRMTYADRYYTYVTNSHNYRKSIVKCGNNKYAEAIKFKIALEFLNGYRRAFSVIANRTKKRETYFHPLKDRKPLTLDYWVWDLKPNIDPTKTIEHYLNPPKDNTNTSTVTNTNTSSGSDTQGKAYAPPTTSPPSKNGSGTMIAVAAIAALLFSKQLKRMFK